MLDPVQRIVAIPLALKVRPASVPSAALYMVTPLPFAIEILEVPVLIIVIASPALKIPEVGGTVIVLFANICLPASAATNVCVDPCSFC